jgi:multiple sugar transport system permease protein
LAQAAPPIADAAAAAGSPRGPVNPAGLSRAGALAFVAPGVLLVLFFLALPAVWTLYLGVTDYALFGPAAAHPQFVGLGNYRQALQDPLFAGAVGVTVAYVVGSAIVGQMVLGFTLAWKLARAPRWMRRTLETLVVLAWIIPQAVVGFLWATFYGAPPQTGTLDAVLHSDVNWLFSFPIPSLVVFNIWRGTAFSMLLSAAALNTVPPSYLETARLSGATGWQQLRDVVFPTIRATLLTNLLLITLWTFNDFTPYILTGGGIPGAVTLPIYIYKQAFQFGFFGLGSAISSLMLMINLLIGLGYLWLSRRSGG